MVSKTLLLLSFLLLTQPSMATDSSGATRQEEEMGSLGIMEHHVSGGSSVDALRSGASGERVACPMVCTLSFLTMLFTVVNPSAYDQENILPKNPAYIPHKNVGRNLQSIPYWNSWLYTENPYPNTTQSGRVTRNDSSKYYPNPEATIMLGREMFNVISSGNSYNTTYYHNSTYNATSGNSTIITSNTEETASDLTTLYLKTMAQDGTSLNISWAFELPQKGVQQVYLEKVSNQKATIVTSTTLNDTMYGAIGSIFYEE